MLTINLFSNIINYKMCRRKLELSKNEYVDVKQKIEQRNLIHFNQDKWTESQIISIEILDLTIIITKIGLAKV